MTNGPTIVDRLWLWLAGSAILASSFPALAASPAAWAGNDRAAAAACIARSDLARASVRPGRVRYDDTLGVDAMLVTGIWRQVRMQGRRATMLCLYHRGSRTAEVVEAPRWRSR